MGPQAPREASASAQTDPAERCEPSAVNVHGREGDGAIDLSALVEPALAIADARGLGLVGIDLCSALERLKCIEGRPAQEGPRSPIR